MAFKAFAVLFGLIAGHTILETARDALFLSTLPASRLTWVYIALAAFGLVVPAYNSRFVRSLGRRNALVFTLMIAASGTVLWHFQASGAVLAYGLYVWSGLLGTVLIVQFWMFSGRLFTVAQGKRLFPGIASGGVLGAVTGGVVASAALELLMQAGPAFAVAHLLLVAAAFFLGTAILLTTIPTDDHGAAFSKPSTEAVGLAGGFAVLKEHPYVRSIAAFVAMSTITVLTTDYLFKYVAKATLSAAELGPFFARYYAVINAVALVMQLVIAHKIVQRVGVVAALALLPLLLVTGGASILVLGSVVTMVLVTKGADGALRHSLHRVASELLYLPLPDAVRDRSKSLIDAVFVRGAQALIAGVILGLSYFGLDSVRVFASMVALFAGAWLLLTIRMKGGYLNLFRDGLGRGTIDPRLLRVEDLDLDSVESVMAALSSTDASRVIAAIELLKKAGRAGLIPALILYHDSDDVQMAALDVVARIDEQDWRPHAVRLTRSASTPVRIAALRALGRAGEADLVREALDDPSPAVQVHAAFQLAVCSGGDSPGEHPAVLSLRARVKAAPIELRREIRLAFLQALREDADAAWADVLLEIAEGERSPVLVESVATAVGRVSDERFIPLLVGWLDVSEARSAVRQALVELGLSAVDALEQALRDDATPMSVKRQIPITLAMFGTQRAADLLTAQLARESDGLVRYRVLRALGRLVMQHAVVVDEQLIDSEVTRNLREHLRLLSIRVALSPDDLPERARASALLLTGLVDDKMRQASERAFRLLQVRFRKEDVRSILSALQSDDRRTHATALEFLDALTLACSDECRLLVRIVADDLPSEDRIARAATYIPDPPTTADDAISRLLDDNDESMAALAFYYAKATAAHARSPQIDELIIARPSLTYAAEAAASLPPVTSDANRPAQ